MFLNGNMRYNTLTICLIAAVIVLLGTVLFLYQRGKPTENMQATERSPSQDGTRPPPPAGAAPAQTGGAPALVLFHATWCPHCKDVLPIWQQLKAGTKGGIQILDIESKDPALTQHQIPGFPTIRFFPRGLSVPQDHQDYKGPRTLEGIVQYLSSL